MKIMVTGGAGYVGSLLCPELAKRKEVKEISVVDTFWFWPSVDQYEHLFWSPECADKLNIYEEDIRNMDFKNLLGHYDVVINLACISNDISSDLDPKFTHDVSYNGVMNVLRGAEENKVRLIQVSSGSVYGVQETPVTETTFPQPITQYAQIKMELDHYLQWLIKNGNGDITILRPATLYGWSPRQRMDLMLNIFAGKVIENKPIVVHGGKQSRPALHVKDFAHTIIEVLFNNNSRGEIYNVSKEAYTVMEYAKLVKKRFPTTEIIVEDVVDQRSWRTDSEKIYRDLGIVHPTKLEQGITSLVVNLLSFGYNERFCKNIKVIRGILGL